jgi:Domain of unknown function (DUF4398)
MSLEEILMIEFSIDRARVPGRAACGLGVLSALLLVACTTIPEPTAALAAAEQAIATADRSRVADIASPELRQAREQLAAARAAAQGQRMAEAERLALESRVDAELASARIDAAKAKAVNEEMRRSTETLRQEMQRNSGAK